MGGEPEDIHEYKALAQKLYLSDRVRFFGKVPHRDIPDYLALFDVAVAPAPATEHSSFYGSPLKMFEYMAAGVPMIVSDLPALREVLSTETALFIKPADAHELAQAVSLLQREPARAQAMAIEARALVEKRFTWHARAQGILSLIQEVHG